MTESESSDFIVVIRSAGERTKEACKYIVTQELPDSCVHLIELIPFEAALRECYKIGMNSGKKWMITIDADVLPRLGFVSKISNLAENVGDNIIMFNAMIHDKLFMQYRTAGFKVYRTAYLNEALAYVAPDGIEVRPEAATLKKMVAKGYRKKNFSYVVGLHDHEQFYKDIYRKAYFHATKHTEKLSSIITDWKTASLNDYDYRVALKGAIDGLISREDGKPDIRLFDENITGLVVSELGLMEKGEIQLNEIGDYIENTIQREGPMLKDYQLQGIKNEIKDRGFLKGFAWSFANLLELTGKKLKHRFK